MPEWGEVRPLDVEAWVAATLDLLDDADRRAALRAAARRALPRFTPEVAAQGYVEALGAVLRG